jgi:hypothetical protein
MQLAARKVLNDVISAYEMLECEDDPQKIRILWIAAISLCRSVGQVLDKIDCRAPSALTEHIKSQWKDIKSNTAGNLIFHEFIEKERNLILKEYQIGYFSGEFQVVVGESCLGILEEGLYLPISHGFYVGEDCRDILAEAINWWNEKLTEIEGYAQNNFAPPAPDAASLAGF